MIYLSEKTYSSLNAAEDHVSVIGRNIEGILGNKRYCLLQLYRFSERGRMQFGCQFSNRQKRSIVRRHVEPISNAGSQSIQAIIVDQLKLAREDPVIVCDHLFRLIFIQAVDDIQNLIPGGYVISHQANERNAVILNLVNIHFPRSKMPCVSEHCILQ